ncbi:hypothetical protein TRIUR3_25468 [Triticum urartu]|uniref:Uncharacterized protein n=1 Tax=Triticum urartu TaxID=4572 RepID=M7Z7X3_TRIUA|nr:hypothetical protein TRIUR3_25468 [Triticum urartu]
MTGGFSQCAGCLGQPFRGIQHIGGFKAGPGRRLVSVVDGLGSALAFQRGEVGRPACVGRKGHEQEGDALEILDCITKCSRVGESLGLPSNRGWRGETAAPDGARHDVPMRIIFREIKMLKTKDTKTV